MQCAHQRLDFPAWIVFSTSSLIWKLVFMRVSRRVVAPLLRALPFALFAVVLIHEGYATRLLNRLTGSPTPVTETVHYRQMERIHARLLEQLDAGVAVPMAFVGDSIVEGWLTSAHFPGSMNLGVGRDTLSGVLARINTKTVQRVPTWVLAIGINDVLRGETPETMTDQVAQLAQRFDQAQRLIWREALPVSGDRWSAPQEALRQQLNTQIRAACMSLPNCLFLPSPEGYAEHLKDWTKDGLHPNAKGYQALTRQLSQVLTSLGEIS